MSKAIIFVISAALLAAIITAVAVSGNAAALSAIQEGANAAHGDGQPTMLFGNGGIISTITNIMLFIAGALAVIMIIIGGIRYATSGGNAASVTAAKNTILFSVIGLVVAIAAFAIVSWVLTIF